MSFLRLLLGRRLATSEQGEHKIGVVAGVPALGFDGLASSAYGPEALLTRSDGVEGGDLNGPGFVQAFADGVLEVCGL